MKSQQIAVFQYLCGVLDSIVEQQDVEETVRKINDLLDESVIVDDKDFSQVKGEKGGYKILQSGKSWDPGHQSPEMGGVSRLAPELPSAVVGSRRDDRRTASME